MYSVGWHTFDWDRRPIQCFASNDEPYTRHIVTGMPRIPDDFLRSVFFLYPSKSDAERGKDAGGTGFIVGFRHVSNILNGHHLYAVSNYHVVCKSGCSVARLNKPNGEVTILESDPSDWDCDQESDVAVMPLSINPFEHHIHYFGKDFFLKKEEIMSKAIGIGDDVFMIGRFVNHDGRDRNMPSVRFGHISMMVTNVPNEDGLEIPSFCLDMHSRSGYSGSPVMIYRTPGSNWDEMVKRGKVHFGNGFMYLLGINWGSFPENLMVSGGNSDMIAKGFSGMTCVSPAWAISEVLMRDKFVKQRNKDEAKILQHYGKEGFPAYEDVATTGDESKGDEILKTMLNTPPNPHSEK